MLGDSGSLASMVVTLAVLGITFYFLLIRPEKKRKKEITELRDSIKVGDQVTSIGGITGTVCAVKGDEAQRIFVVETGADRVRIELAKWAISTKGAPPVNEPEK